MDLQAQSEDLWFEDIEENPPSFEQHSSLTEYESSQSWHDWFTNCKFKVEETAIPIFSQFSAYSKVKFQAQNPAILLGKAYVTPLTRSPLWEDQTVRSESVDLKYKFMCEFSKLYWVTYRSSFPPIRQGSEYRTSDAGWGCMIRTGQMMLLQWLQIHYPELTREEGVRLISELRPEAPYSIHKICEVGGKMGKHLGDWYSPSIIWHILAELVDQEDLSAIVFRDRIIYNSDIMRASGVQKYHLKWKCQDDPILQTNNDQQQSLSDSFDVISDASEDNICQVCGHEAVEELEIAEWTKGVLCMIPLMLGVSAINEEYIDPLKFFFELPWSLGVIGGRPNLAMYFMGYQGNDLIFLDPHNIQPTSNEPNTYEYDIPKCIPISKLDSSMALGLYFRTQDDWNNFKAYVENNQDRLRGIIILEEVKAKMNLNDDIHIL